jgi:hypothetical protein
VVDEAGLVPRLAHVWHTALRPTLADHQGLAWFLGTPKGVGDFSALWSQGQGEGRSEDWASWRLPTSANPFIRAEEIEAMRLSMPDLVFRQEVLGEPIAEGDHPIGLDAIRLCVAPLARGPAVVYGVDLARAVDFTVAIALASATPSSDATVCHVERWKSPWGVTRTKLQALLGSTLAFMDSTGVGDPVVEDLQRAGSRVVGKVFTARFKQKMIEGLIAAIQQQRLMFPDGWLRGELESLRAEKTALGTRYSAPEGLHDDGVMALALAWLGYHQTYHAERPEKEVEAKRDNRAPHFNFEKGTFDRVDPMQALEKMLGQGRRPPLGARRGH